jgi:hypothetical protein
LLEMAKILFRDSSKPLLTHAGQHMHALARRHNHTLARVLQSHACPALHSRLHSPAALTGISDQFLDLEDSLNSGSMSHQSSTTFSYHSPTEPSPTDARRSYVIDEILTKMSPNGRQALLMMAEIWTVTLTLSLATLSSTCLCLLSLHGPTLQFACGHTDEAIAAKNLETVLTNFGPYGNSHLKTSTLLSFSSAASYNSCATSLTSALLPRPPQLEA